MGTESLNEHLDIPLTMTLGAILLLECWKCFKITNGTQAKDSKSQKSLQPSAYFCILVICILVIATQTIYGAQFPGSEGE